MQGSSEKVTIRIIHFIFVAVKSRLWLDWGRAAKWYEGAFANIFLLLQSL